MWNGLLKEMLIPFFFHSYANGRRRKKIIFSLEDEGECLTGEEKNRVHIYKYYKNPFGYEFKQSVNLSRYFWNLGGKISEANNESLVQAFSEEEVWEIIKDLPAESAPVPDGFPTF